MRVRLVLLLVIGLFVGAGWFIFTRVPTGFPVAPKPPARSPSVRMTQPPISPAPGTPSIALEKPTPIPPPPTPTPTLPGPERIAAARKAHESVIREKCRAVGLNYPPRELFFRAFKHEGHFEAWGRDKKAGPMQRIGVWRVTAASGRPGPKRREGDRQVPEGCYQVVVFNPESSFHLSLGLDYPNAADRILSDPKFPGFDIYIHGGAMSVGCLPVGDDAMEEIFLLAYDAHQKHRLTSRIHIFPTKMEGPGWETIRQAHPEHAALWQELQPIYDAFEKTQTVPNVKVTEKGAYEIAAN